jgi:hypothetical protein
VKVEIVLDRFQSAAPSWAGLSRSENRCHVVFTHSRSVEETYSPQRGQGVDLIPRSCASAVLIPNFPAVRRIVDTVEGKVASRLLTKSVIARGCQNQVQRDVAKAKGETNLQSTTQFQPV